MNTPTSAGLMVRLHALYTRVFTAVGSAVSADILPLLARLTLAGVFWRSLLTKVETAKLFTYTEYINDFPVERARMRLPELPLDIKAGTYHQFANEFALPLIPPGWAALGATLAEFVLPILLLVGVLTRFSAAALLGMTLVIQFFVYPEAWWGTHAMWAVMCLYLMVQGPGRLSADHFAGQFFAR